MSDNNVWNFVIFMTEHIIQSLFLKYAYTNLYVSRTNTIQHRQVCQVLQLYIKAF